MNKSKVLLITGDQAQARALAQAIIGENVVQTSLAGSGETAVNWTTEHPFDVCVLNYRLPGIDGLETLLQLRQRCPTMPILLLSDANSENVAVAAFRYGVTDYIPLQRGYEISVADRVKRLLQTGMTAITAAAASSADTVVPSGSFRANYQNRLRLIGRQLDLYSARAITLTEVTAGILVRRFSSSLRLSAPLEFTEGDFPRLGSAAVAARQNQSERPQVHTDLFPTGYEDFLRALGFWLDSQQASTIQIVELNEAVLVTAMARVGSQQSLSHYAVQVTFGPETTQQLLDHAFHRRGMPAQTPPPRNALRRRLG